MKILMSKLKKRHLVLAVTIITGFAALLLAPVVKAQADSGPTIYDSTYIDALEVKLKGLIQSSGDELKKQISAISTQSDLQKELSDTKKELAALKESMAFKIIQLPKGKILLGGASTEIIVRTKSGAVAYIEKTASGGLANLISGKDIPNNAVIQDNQLLLVPAEDGRGIKATKDAYIMIKGTYTIK